MKNLIDYTQEELGHILDTIENQKSYYVGGSLCVDKHLPDGDVMVFSLDESVNSFISGKERLLSIANVKKVFDIYLKFRGNTHYYIDKYSQSIIKYL